MAYQSQEMKGYLNPNKYHKKGDKQPCLRGSLLVNGVEHELAVWAPREGQTGYYFKMSVKDSSAQQATKPNDQQQLQSMQRQEPPKAAPVNTSSLFKR